MPRERWLIRVTLLLAGFALCLYLLPAFLSAGIRNASQIAYARAAFGQPSSITWWAQPLWQITRDLLPPQRRSANQRLLARAVWANGDDAGAAMILSLGGEAAPANIATYFHPDWSTAGQAMPDTLAAHHLARASAALAAGDEEGAGLWLDAALVLRPDDLYANYQRWRLESKQSTRSEQIRQRLRKFSERALLPANSDVAAYAIEVAPALVAEGIWTPKQLERAADAWVWHYPELEILGNLLDSQCKAQPIDGQWCELATERIRRDNGGSVDNHALDTAALLAQLDITQAIPGKSTLRHGGIETWSSLSVAREWGWYEMTSPPGFDRALFVGGVDNWEPFAGDNAMRIDGLWQTPGSGADIARAGYWIQPEQTLEPGSAWLLSFAYRTRGDQSSAAVWLGDQSQALPPEFFLPGTGGEWREEAVLVSNQGSTPMDVRPLFRNWGEQPVWFDEIQLQPLSGVDGAELPAWKTTWEVERKSTQEVLVERNLSRAAGALSDGDEAGAIRWLDAVLAARPDDLYANYHRFKLEADQNGDSAKEHLRRLQQFTEGALLPPNQQIAAYAMEVAPALVADAIWTSAQLQRAAAAWMWRYPDLQGLGALLDEHCTDKPEDASWCLLAGERTNRLADSQTIVAPTDSAYLLSELGLDGALGPSVYQHGAVETWSDPATAQAWVWNNLAGPPNFDQALYLGGVDTWQPFAGEDALRVDGVWQMQESGSTRARAGYWAQPATTIEPNEVWLLSFAYRTRGNDSTASIWLGGQLGVLPSDLFLPGTGGEWRYEAVLLANQGSTPYDVRPLVRNWGEQTVWFDEIALQPVSGVNVAELPAWKTTWEP